MIKLTIPQPSAVLVQDIPQDTWFTGTLDEGPAAWLKLQDNRLFGITDGKVLRHVSSQYPVKNYQPFDPKLLISFQYDRKKQVLFEELSEGEVFLWMDDLYVKVDQTTIIDIDEARYDDGFDGNYSAVVPVDLEIKICQSPLD